MCHYDVTLCFGVGDLVVVCTNRFMGWRRLGVRGVNFLECTVKFGCVSSVVKG